MSYRKPIALAGLLLALGLFAWLLSPREPVYGGKTISAWLTEQHRNADKFDGGAIQSGIEAFNAVHQTGSNALPVLLRLARAQDSPLKMRIRWIEAKLKSRFKTRYRRLTPADQHEMAKFGFQVLGPEAAPAVPDLLPLLSDKDAGVRATAALCLCAIGPAAQAAVPALLKLLNDPDYLACHAAILALGNIHAQPALVVPILKQRISVAQATAYDLEPTLDALAHYGPAARSAVPALLQFATNSDSSIRISALSALKAIDPEAAAKAEATSATLKLSPFE